MPNIMSDYMIFVWEISEICLTFSWDLPQIYQRYALDIKDAKERTEQKTCLRDSVTEKVTSREAITSNRQQVSLLFLSDFQTEEVHIATSYTLNNSNSYL